MGILLAAMAAAGDQAVKSIDSDEAQQNALDRLTLQSQLEGQKAQTLIDYKNKADLEQSDAIREDRAKRLTPTQDEIQGIIARRANSVTDYDSPTDPNDHSPASYAELPDEDQTNPNFQPSQYDLLQLQQRKALADGDLESAAKITEALKGGHVSTGYGSQTRNMLDTDPETGEATIIGDTSSNRDTYNTGKLGILQQNADTNKTKAAAAAAKGVASKGADPLFQSYKAISIQLGHELEKARDRRDLLPGKEKPAATEAIAAINARLLDNQQKMTARGIELDQRSVGKPGGGTATPSGTDHSALWD